MLTTRTQIVNKIMNKCGGKRQEVFLWTETNRKRGNDEEGERIIYLNRHNANTAE